MDTNALDYEPLPLAASRRFVWTASHLQSTRCSWPGWDSGFPCSSAAARHLHNVDTMIERFTSWGVPMPKVSVYVSGCTEMIGGLLIMVGLATRLVSLVLVFNFIVAYLTASKEKVHNVVHGPFSSDNWGDILDDAAFPFLIIMLVFLAFGPGKASLDCLIKRLVFKPKPGMPPRDSSRSRRRRTFERTGRGKRQRLIRAGRADSTPCLFFRPRVAAVLTQPRLWCNNDTKGCGKGSCRHDPGRRA